MNFRSDNIVGIHPAILQAVIDANQHTEVSYGGDNYSKQMQDVFSKVFEKEVTVYLTSTGTAANSLSLSSLVQPFETVYCHEGAHINSDECSAPEFFTGGAKLIGIPGSHGKMDIGLLESAIESGFSLRPHTAKPGCISLTQVTEYGTVYSLEELEKIKEIAQKYHLPIHMDGARFTNALVHLGCTPAELTWKSGVDVMSFGATKNGAMSGEAVVFFNSKYVKNFDYRQKRAGQMMSKMRFFACQFLGYFKEDLWIQNAQHANNMAQKLKNVFEDFGLKIEHPVQANEVFVHLPESLAKNLMQKGGGFYEWGLPGSNLYRFVTSCFTRNEELELIGQYLNEFCLKRD